MARETTNAATGKDYYWDVEWTLSCNHTTPTVRIPGRDIQQRTPRRVDHSFGAMRCPEGCGRRRVEIVASHSTGIEVPS